MNSVLWDYPLPNTAVKRLSGLTAKSVSTIQGTTFSYLSKKFGWGLRPTNVSRALNQTLHKVKFFCPYCLRDHPYFILPWRFNLLPGCHLHNCKLVDQCPHCHEKLTLDALYCGILCPHCGEDLSTSEAEILPPDQRPMVLVGHLTRRCMIMRATADGTPCDSG